MTVRVAGALSFVVFACCLLIGGFAAQNPFATVVWRAVLAMAGTFVIGLIIGRMAQGIVNENIATLAESKSPQNSERNSTGRDR